MAHNNGMVPQGGFAEAPRGFGEMTGAEIAGFVPHRPARPEKSEGGKAFRLVSEYEPAGDQPTAIAELVGAINANERDQVLLGVTGSGKTFTMANVIARSRKPRGVRHPVATIVGIAVCAALSTPKAIPETIIAPASINGSRS